MQDLIAYLKTDEGFRDKPYQDQFGNWTLGYGLDIDQGITEEEAAWLIEHRVAKTRAAIKHRWHFATTLPKPLMDALTAMAYQIGVEGMFKFKKMLAAIEAGDYEQAIRESRDSLWFRQTPHRTQRLINALRRSQSPDAA